MPPPICEIGYTEDQIRSILGDHFDDFIKWMHGQTLGYCDGRRYSHEDQEYYEVCGGESHGAAYYQWDVKRFINMKLDFGEVWD